MVLFEGLESCYLGLGNNLMKSTRLLLNSALPESGQEAQYLKSKGARVRMLDFGFLVNV